MNSEIFMKENPHMVIMFQTDQKTTSVSCRMSKIMPPPPQNTFPVAFTVCLIAQIQCFFFF